MSEEEKTMDEEWLKDHFFVKDDDKEVWRLSYYGGLFINMERLHSGWRGSGTFCNGDGGIDACNQFGLAAEETTMRVIDALDMLLKQLSADLADTKNALQAKKPTVALPGAPVEASRQVGEP